MDDPPLSYQKAGDFPFRVGATLAVVPFPIPLGWVGCRKGSPYAEVFFQIDKARL